MPTDADISLAKPDVSSKLVLTLGFGFIVFVGASLVGLRVYFTHAELGTTIAPPKEFPAPRLETHHMQDISELLRAQQEELQNYSWVDRDKGILRIPIARAIEAIVARGSGAFDAPEPPGPAQKAPP